MSTAFQTFLLFLKILEDWCHVSNLSYLVLWSKYCIWPCFSLGLEVFLYDLRVHTSLYVGLIDFSHVCVVQGAENGYQIPAEEIRVIVDAPPTPSLSFSPNKEHILYMQRRSLPPLSDIARAELKLAGMRIDPEYNTRSRMWVYFPISFAKWSVSIFSFPLPLRVWIFSLFLFLIFVGQSSYTGHSIQASTYTRCFTTIH